MLLYHALLSYHALKYSPSGSASWNRQSDRVRSSCRHRATTHTDLELRARALNISTKVIHNASIMNAVGACGLQLYRYGEVCEDPDTKQLNHQGASIFPGVLALATLSGGLQHKQFSWRSLNPAHLQILLSLKSAGSCSEPPAEVCALVSAEVLTLQRVPCRQCP